MINVSIVGVSGYIGKMLYALCCNHPSIESVNTYASMNLDTTLHQLFPEMVGVLPDSSIQGMETFTSNSDLSFFCLPHGHSLAFIPSLLKSGKKVIDLSGDFRLDTPQLYDTWYGFNHTATALLKEKIYGLADWPDSAYSGQPLIANPGCYPTAVLLSLLPIVTSLQDSIIAISTVAYSGTSGAGKAAKQELLLSEMDGNVRAYSVNTHRHEIEIAQQLKKQGYGGPFAFIAHLLPLSHGIYATSTVHFSAPVDQKMIDVAYKNAYAATPFVRMRPVPPHLKWVVNTNFCDMSAAACGNRVVVTAAIDNLIKGGAGQAIQNMNRMFHLSPATGLHQLSRFSR
ncbi:MAG: N-acetyl-gamma-glutamyl-phosphate reductase [Chitinivibrionales bacterium]|nr:N-acetyl-gamma-glutamyl-phosphate reductase [Chitinivibrionales bacterium]